MSDTQTYGELLASSTLGPDTDPRLRRLRELYAEIMDILNDGRGTVPPTRAGHEAALLFSAAITFAMTAQMWSVKATSFKL